MGEEDAEGADEGEAVDVLVRRFLGPAQLPLRLCLQKWPLPRMLAGKPKALH